MPRVFLFRLCLSMAVFFWPIAQSGASYLVERLQKYFCLISPTFFVSAIKLYFNFPFSCCVILNYHSAPLVQSSTNKADLDRVKKVTSFRNTSFYNKLSYTKYIVQIHIRVPSLTVTWNTTFLSCQFLTLFYKACIVWCHRCAVIG